jgi:hypothetical protein
MGFNPYFHSTDLIASELRKHQDIMNVAPQVKGVYFYGAGCSSPELNEIVEKGLAQIFPTANILVEHDLLACAYATYQGAPAISCIVGTGSNSCYLVTKAVEVILANNYFLLFYIIIYQKKLKQISSRPISSTKT